MTIELTAAELAILIRAAEEHAQRRRDHGNSDDDAQALITKLRQAQGEQAKGA